MPYSWNPIGPSDFWIWICDGEYRQEEDVKAADNYRSYENGCASISFATVDLPQPRNHQRKKSREKLIAFHRFSRITRNCIAPNAGLSKACQQTSILGLCTSPLPSPPLVRCCEVGGAACMGLPFRRYGQTCGRGPQEPLTLISASLSIWGSDSSIPGIRPHRSQGNPALQQLPRLSAGL